MMMMERFVHRHEGMKVKRFEFMLKRQISFNYNWIEWALTYTLNWCLIGDFVFHVVLFLLLLYGDAKINNVFFFFFSPCRYGFGVA